MEEKVAAIIAALRERYPDALCALHYGKDYELMISVRLSAQCTDARVNQVTPALFARFPTLEAFAEADVAEVETYVRSCGFFHHKAQDIVAACRMLRDEYGGRVPDSCGCPASGGRRPTCCWATSTASRPSCATRTASASQTASGWPAARSRRRSSGSCAPSSRRKKARISATGSSCSAARCARRAVRTATGASCGRIAESSAGNEEFDIGR